ncbi:beta-lactamase family protein [Streptomyces sp. R302]|uniref:serine hydrolase domain-containing protein n=1 Tax=unclassified Streptomyces TaxID=2593676 RepID=UPI00145D30D0|nr:MULTISPECIES: serine hydrolase domain-containing protein [unclassified Streptomyces]NML51797.1 beta-lactamase family protein [Streptomyces sp. R301]NML81417.1 beta-lactamase family protein [Streptomyces sp. R302]
MPRSAPARRPYRPYRPRRVAVAALLLAAALTAPALPYATAGERPAAGARGGGGGSGGGESGEERELRRALAELVAAPGGPPGAIAVLTRDGDRRVYRAGTARLGSGTAKSGTGGGTRPPRADDHMRIASAAKAFSGAVALGLVDRDALALDDTLGKRLPHLPKAWHAVTLRQLLQHTSGLPDFSRSARFQAIVRADPRHRFDSRRLLEFVAGESLAFPPGSRYAYSNSDNIAVALMAEQATGRRYEDLLRELVYRPLDLRDTSLPSGFRLPRPFLHGYDTTPGEPPEDVSEAISASGAWASGGIVSTPADLNTFIGGYAGPGLLSPGTRHAQRRFVPGESQPAGPGVNAAGLALFRYETRCGTVFGHTGNTPGYTQFAAATRDGRRAVTVSVSSQVPLDPALLARLRATEERFVCALLTA